MLFYRDYGDGHPVLLIHGLLGSADNWHTVATMLAERFRVVAPDLRNHGRSPHSEELSYKLLADDVVELITRLDLQDPILVGHSMGGKTAMELALSYPDVPRGLVIEDMVPGRTAPVSGKYIRLLREINLGAIQRRKDAEEILLRSIDDRALVLFLLKNLARGPEGSFTWRANLSALDAEYDSLWQELPPGREWGGPVLFIRGARSGIVADELFGEIFSYFPKARITTVKEAGHWVHADGLTQFMIHLNQFLDAQADAQADAQVNAKADSHAGRTGSHDQMPR
jgi:pimeloyl-ACP methyl ester carboxylesterase